MTAPPARDALVAVRLPADLAQVARERRYLGPGDCPGGVQAAIKRPVAVSGDVVDPQPSRVLVNDSAGA